MAKARAAKRERIDTGTDTRFVRRGKKGQFKESDDVGKSLAVDSRKPAKRFTAFVTVLLLTVTSGTPAQSSVAGDWDAVFVGPVAWRPKMFERVTFSILDTPDGLVGLARAGTWPGDLQLSDIAVVGDRVSFAGTSKLWWRTMRDGVFTEFCCPKLLFDGKIRGDEIDLAMIWTSTDPRASEQKDPLQMLAKRVTK